MMDAQGFISGISSISLPAVFNPYRDLCQDHDHSGSADIRRRNLERYLQAFAGTGVHSVWLGRDCGYRGGRRTGIALTDELQLPALAHRLGTSGISKATLGGTVKERTATEVWKAISGVQEAVFLWNIFPFHPFEPGCPMSNRRHTAREFYACSELLLWLLEWLRPEMIVTLGGDAHAAVIRLGFHAFRVRHPSYGGHREFAVKIRELYPIRSEHPDRT